MLRVCFLWVNFLLVLVAVKSHPSFVVTTTEQSTDKEGPKADDKNVATPVPKIYEMQVTSNVSNRFARTLVASRVKNPATTSQETAFSVVLPETAYISGFVLEIGGKSYNAYVKEKEEAKSIYNEARQSGLSAAHVAASARDSNRFDVSVNLEPESKAAFLLTYEELLKRENNLYEIVINIHPGQPVRNMVVEVNINESRPLRFVNAPAIRSGNEISKFSEKDLASRAEITRLSNASSNVKFEPNVERQKQLAASLGTEENEGLAGQFVVQYDVERDPQGGEVLLQDGYFVHFFAPTDVKPLPKHVIFVLDTSGSMYDRKIEQLKQAMRSILSELKQADTFNLVEFNSYVRVHDVERNASVVYPREDVNFYYRPAAENVSIGDFQFPNAIEVTAENVKLATEKVQNFEANGGTDIYSALEVALRLVQLARANERDSERRQPLVVFLTDGEPTVGVTGTGEIISKVSELNIGAKKTPIFALSFGDGADKDFLQRLSLRNEGFSRHIYEAADASLQLEDFYKQVSSPLLTDVKFKYTPSVSKVTKTNFPILFAGSELVVAGAIDSKEFPESPVVQGWGVSGTVELKPAVARPVAYLERLWAYLTVKQILEAKETAENKTAYDKMALDLALKYSFVTPVSSLVVVKPNDTNGVVEPVAADKVALEESGISYGLSTKDSFMSYRRPLAPQSSHLSAPGPFGSYAALMPSTGLSGVAYNKAAIRTTPMYAFAAPPSFDPSVVDDPIVEETETTTTTVSNLDKIQTKLPWLSSLLSENGTITTTTGTYDLGLNESISDGPECPNTPVNGDGKCALLHECTSVLSLLTNVNIFQQYVCDLRGFAGICCPVDKYVRSG